MDQDEQRVRQALRNFKRLHALEPSHTGHLEQLARLSLELGQTHQAARYMVQRAEILAERDEPAAALGSVHDALEVDPHNDKARTLLERLQAAVPSGEFLLPEGRTDLVLPVKDDLLATDDSLFGAEEMSLDTEVRRDTFLPKARRDRPAGADSISQVAARLSAGLGRGEPDHEPAADSIDEPVTERNELVSALAEADGSLEGEVTRDFTVDRIADALVDDATAEQRALREDDVETGRPQPMSEELEVLASDEFEIVSGEYELFDVSADDVLSERPITGKMPGLPPRPREPSDISLDGSTMDLHRSEVEEEITGEFEVEPPVGRSMTVRVDGRVVPVGPPLSELPRDVLEELIGAAGRRVLRSGKAMVRAGDRFEGPLLVVRGTVARETGAEGRRPALLAPAEAGDVVGLVELVRGGRWRAAIRAEAEVELMALPVRKVDEARGDHPTWETSLRNMARRQLADLLLAASGLFGHLSADQRTQLGRRFRVRMFGSGDVLIERGQPIDGLYLVIAGEVDVEQDRVYLTTLGEGDFVGVVAAVEKSPTRVRAVAATPVEAFYLDPAALQAALKVPEVHAAFSAVVERRRTVLDGGRF